MVTFYALFNLEPQGEHTICICRGTACHTRGSRNLLQRLRLELGLPEESEDGADKVCVTTARPAATPCAPWPASASARWRPVVEVDHAIFGHMNEQALHRELEHLPKGAQSVTRIQDIGTFSAVREAGMAKLLPTRPRIGVGMGTCGAGNGAEGVYHAFAEAINQQGRDVRLAAVGCFGFCAQEPLVNVRLPGKPLVILRRVQASDVRRILDDLAAGTVTEDLALCKIEEWDHLTAHIQYGTGFPNIPLLAGHARSSSRRRRSCCATAASSVPTISKSTSRWAATRPYIRC